MGRRHRDLQTRALARRKRRRKRAHHCGRRPDDLHTWRIDVREPRQNQAGLVCQYFLDIEYDARVVRRDDCVQATRDALQRLSGELASCVPASERYETIRLLQRGAAPEPAAYVPPETAGNHPSQLTQDPRSRAITETHQVAPGG